MDAPRKSLDEPEIDPRYNKMLRRKFWVILTRGAKPVEEIRKYRDAHLAHQMKLEKEGILFAAGPLADPDGTLKQYGLIIIRAESAEEAKRIADMDPMHQHGMREYTLHKWSLNEGRINISIDFSDRSSNLS